MDYGRGHEPMGGHGEPSAKDRAEFDKKKSQMPGILDGFNIGEDKEPEMTMDNYQDWIGIAADEPCPDCGEVVHVNKLGHVWCGYKCQWGWSDAMKAVFGTDKN